MATTIFTAELKETSGDEIVPNVRTSGTAVESITVQNHEKKLIITCTTA